MLYDVNVTRISTATKTVRVEADNREEAEERAVERRTTRTLPAASWSMTSSAAERWKRRTRIHPAYTRRPNNDQVV